MANIEAKVKQNPEVFEEVFKSRKEDIAFALKDLSQKLDIVIWGAITEYADKEGVQVNLEEISSYKTLDKLITKQLDEYIGEFLLQKRKVIE